VQLGRFTSPSPRRLAPPLTPHSHHRRLPNPTPTFARLSRSQLTHPGSAVDLPPIQRRAAWLAQNPVREGGSEHERCACRKRGKRSRCAALEGPGRGVSAAGVDVHMVRWSTTLHEGRSAVGTGGLLSDVCGCGDGWFDVNWGADSLSRAVMRTRGRTRGPRRLSRPRRPNGGHRTRR
jgi:hypothetical protein